MNVRIINSFKFEYRKLLMVNVIDLSKSGIRKSIDLKQAIICDASWNPVAKLQSTIPLTNRECFIRLKTILKQL